MLFRTLFLSLLVSTAFSLHGLSQEYENTVLPSKEQHTPEAVAVAFITEYITFCNNQNATNTLKTWVESQPLVSERFKTSLRNLLTAAETRNPELGLGFDPILNAQDYPDSGFEFDSISTNKKCVTVKGREWAEFTMRISMERIQGEWMVDGAGVVNMPGNCNVE